MKLITLLTVSLAVLRANKTTQLKEEGNTHITTENNSNTPIESELVPRSRYSRRESTEFRHARGHVRGRSRIQCHLIASRKSPSASTWPSAPQTEALPLERTNSNPSIRHSDPRAGNRHLVIDPPRRRQASTVHPLTSASFFDWSIDGDDLHLDADLLSVHPAGHADWYLGLVLRNLLFVARPSKRRIKKKLFRGMGGGGSESSTWHWAPVFRMRVAFNRTRVTSAPLRLFARVCLTWIVAYVRVYESKTTGSA